MTILEYVPNYFDIIERGSERDLGTIRANVERDLYPTIEAVDAEVDLMLHNCFTYNAPDNQVYKSGEEFRTLWKAGIAKIKAEQNKSNKRAGDKNTGGSSKKAKY